MIEQHNAMQQAHNRNEEFECLTCKKLFLTKWRLGSYVQGVHRHTLSFQEVHIQNEVVCNTCDKIFTRETTLKEHNRQKHETPDQIEESIQKCEYCGKHFTTSSILKRHLQINASDQDQFEDLKHQCEYCEKRLTTVSNLKRHLRTHAGRGDKSYENNLQQLSTWRETWIFILMIRNQWNRSASIVENNSLQSQT